MKRPLAVHLGAGGGVGGGAVSTKPFGVRSSFQKKKKKKGTPLIEKRNQYR